MKKIIALFLCLLLLVSLVACGKDKEKNEEKDKEKDIETMTATVPTDSQSEGEPDSAEMTQDASAEDEQTTSALVEDPSENDEEPSADEEEPTEAEAHDHTHINYKGQVQIFTPEDLVAIEGRECDFTYEQNGSTMYIYNNVTVDEMNFTQVQFTFNKDHNRVSCTYSVNKGTEEAPRDAAEIAAEVAEVLSSYEQSIAKIYGEGLRSEQHGSQLISWNDHTGNYMILTQINDTTVQLAYYIYSK